MVASSLLFGESVLDSSTEWNALFTSETSANFSFSEEVSVGICVVSPTSVVVYSSEFLFLLRSDSGGLLLTENKFGLIDTFGFKSADFKSDFLLICRRALLYLSWYSEKVLRSELSVVLELNLDSLGRKRRRTIGSVFSSSSSMLVGVVVLVDVLVLILLGNLKRLKRLTDGKKYLMFLFIANKLYYF